MRSHRDGPEPDGGDPGGGEHRAGGDRGDDGAAAGATGDAAASGAGAGDATGGGPVVPPGGQLAQLVGHVHSAERELAQAVVLAGRLAGSGAAEAEAGMPVEQVLLTACRLTGADRHTLVTAGELLGDMPQLRELFVAGEVSWGQVRGICQQAKWLSRQRLAWLDAQLTATIAQRGHLAGFDPDELVGAASDTIRELTELDRVERDERDRVAASFVSIQPDFLGGVRAYGELDAQLAGPIMAALQAASPPPHAGQAHHRRHASGGDDAHGGPVDEGQDHRGDAAARSGWSGPSRSRQHAQGLFHIAAQWLAGQPAGGDGAASNDAPGHDCPAGSGDDTGDGEGARTAGGATAQSVTARSARPQLIVHVGLAQATAALAGHVDLAAGGPLPRLTAAAVEALSCSGDVQAVVFDGARPLATTTKTTAAAIPASTREAVEARDLGCRWPGCRAPLAHTEIHHLRPTRQGGTHDPSNLVCLCRVHHLQAHGRGWTLTIDTDTATVTGRRHGHRCWTSHPPATPLTRSPHHPHDRSDPPDGRDPPDPSDGSDGRDPPAQGPFVDGDGHPLPF